MNIFLSSQQAVAAVCIVSISVLASANSQPADAQRSEDIPFAKYIGGELDESSGDVALAPNGDRVFCASAQSSGLATAGAIQAAPAGQYDVIVGRLAAADGALQFLTYFGGTRLDVCNRIAVDSAGDIIIAGYTTSSDFPTVNAADSTYAGGGFRNQDGFVAKFSGDGGSVVFATYLGGLDATIQSGGFPGDETVRGLVIDSADRILVAGATAAPDFPATHVLGDGGCGDDPTPVSVGATGDQFVARYLPDGSVDFTTCISATEIEYGGDVAVSDQGLIYVAGSTVSPDYPTTQPDIGPGAPGAGSYDVVITVLNASGTQILHAVRVGSSTEDFVQNIELNSMGQVIVQAVTDGQDFPTTTDAWQPEPGLSTFVAREWDNSVFGLSADLDALIFATYVGGEGDDLAFSLTLDLDRPVLHMDTDSRELATVAPIQAQKAGVLDVFAPFDSNAVSTFSRGGSLNVNVSGLDLFAVAGPGLNRLWLLNPTSIEYEIWRELEEGENDTRVILFDDVNRDGNPDIVTGNYEGLNYVYFGEFSGNFGPPVAFGDPQTRTTSLAVVRSSSGGTCVVEFVEDDVNVQHTYFAGSFDGGQPLGTTVTAARDAGSVGSQIVEISAPDQVTLYDGCGDGPVMQAVDVATFPGRDLVDLDAWAFDAGSLDDVAFADRNGGVLVIRDIGDEPFGQATTQTDGPPANAVLIRELGGLISAHDSSYRFYEVDQATLELVLESDVPASNPGNDLLRSFDTGSIYATTSAGLEQSGLGSADVYLVRLAADGSDADFATYLGGGGNDAATAGLVVAGQGRLFGSAITSSQSFPGTQDKAPFPNSGRRDVVLFELTIAGDTLDTDGDGVIDAQDNCTLVVNPQQVDANGDGFGNVCDQDIDNNGIVNFGDLGVFRAAFFGNPDSANWNPEADFNGDGNVGFVDLGLLRASFFRPPGPAGTIE